jgi:hypothetical protein
MNVSIFEARSRRNHPNNSKSNNNKNQNGLFAEHGVIERF